MEQLPGGYTLTLPKGTFPLSTDSMVLSHFVRLPKHARVLDLGSGCATLGLLLCAREETCTVTGVELNPDAHKAAVENIRCNALQTRMQSICADLRQVPEYFPAGSYTCCVSNPPYFSGGPASKSAPLARREDTCTPEDLFRAAAWALKYGGDFFLVHRPERLSELIISGAKAGLEAKQLCLVRHNPSAPVSLILLKMRKGAKPGIIWDELTLHNADGTPTRSYLEIYHMEET